MNPKFAVPLRSSPGTKQPCWLEAEARPSARSFSTSSATQIVNGRSSVTVTLQFPVAGASGRQALAVVRQAKGSSSSPVVSIEVARPCLCKLSSSMHSLQGSCLTCLHHMGRL